MDFNKLISSRLGKENFYINSYYKFEKYSNIKQKYIEDHKDVFLLDFGIGEGDDMPSFKVLNSLSNESLKYENRVYSDNGIDEFKIAASDHLLNNYNVKVKDPLKNINHIMGAKSALCILPIAFIDEDDIVITTTPGYQVLANMSKWLKAKIYYAPLTIDNDYLIDLDAIDESIYQKCKLFIINYPNNPTGSIANKQFYEKLISLALKYNFIIINDATYALLTYNKKPLSIMSIDNAFSCAIEIHSFSKSYNMTGMRIGFVVANEKLIDIFKKVKDNIDSGQYIPIQKAAIKAIYSCDDYVNRLKKKYYERMKNICRILNKHNLKCNMSKGTFYLYLKAPLSFASGDDFSRFLLNEAGIFTIPYDEVDHYVRLSMTFKVKTDENDFYEEFDKRLTKIKKQCLQ